MLILIPFPNFMKNLFSFLIALVALHALWPSQVEAQPLVNGDFETQYASGPPTTTSNIKNTSPGYADELPSWATVNSYNANTNNNATYVATNSTAGYPLNPTQDFDPYTPHSGRGCVLLLGDHSHRFDGLITQQVSLTAGHTYSFSYYARRLAYSNQINKLAFSIVYGNNAPANDASAAVNDLVPSPAVRMRSDFITLDQWVQVSGSFVAPTTGTAWVVLGFDNSDTQTGTNLPPAVSSTDSIHLVVDDVSLQDMGCLAPYDPQVSTPDWTCTIGSRGPVQATIDDYNPAYTYTVRATNNLSAGAITVVNGKGRFQVRSSRAGATGTITVTATTTCGASAATSFDLTSPDCGGGSGPRATAYPNPTSESLTVPTNNQDATLFNSQGRPVRKADASGKINVRDLPAGIYNLQMQQGAERINQRIEIKH